MNRREIRRRLRNDLLPHLNTIARDTSAEKPSLAQEFEIPGFNLSSARFYAASKAMLDKGVAEKDLLMKHGLSDKLLDDLAAAVSEFEASITATNTSRENHIAARAALERGSEELLPLVEMMDGINRYRFRNDPELLTAWNAAKHVVSGPAGKDGPLVTQPGLGEAGSGTAPATDVKPAA